MASITSATAIATTDLLTQWGNIVVGNWTVNAGSIGNGTISASWNAQHTAIQGSFQLNNPSIPSGSWTVASDPGSGTLKQTEVNSDGSKGVTTITQLGSNQFSQQTQCANQDNSPGETNNTLCTVSSDGNTITQQVSNRMLNGASLPDVTVVLTRSAVATPAPTAATITPTLLFDYATAVAGNWSVSAQGVGGGGLSIAFNSAGNALIGHFQLSGVPSATFNVSQDPNNPGQLIQSQINSDGTTATVTIVQVPPPSSAARGATAASGSSYAASTSCGGSAAARGAGGLETSNTLATFSNGGSTMTHTVTNRQIGGVSQPDITVTFTRLSTV